MLRLKIYQETSHFRIATIGNPYLSYLLPPPSTVYGFLRKITNYENINYKNTKLSIQGFFNGMSFEKERLVLETKKGIKTNIIPIQKLHETQWVIHINSEEILEQKIFNSLKKNKDILRFGRTEDLIIDYSFEKVGEQDIKNFNPEENILHKYNIYLTWKNGMNFKGQIFSMFVDSEVDENLKIIGYKPIQLIYCSINTIKENIKITDGKYYVAWII